MHHRRVISSIDTIVIYKITNRQINLISDHVYRRAGPHSPAMITTNPTSITNKRNGQMPLWWSRAMIPITTTISQMATATEIPMQMAVLAPITTLFTFKIIITSTTIWTTIAAIIIAIQIMALSSPNKSPLCIKTTWRVMPCTTSEH